MFDREAIEAAKVTYITPENAKFTDHEGYLTMNFNGEEKKVLLHLLFPYDSKDENISVLDDGQHEIGIISDMKVFDGDSRVALEKEIARKYYIREITKILDLKDRHGITAWKVKCKENPGDIAEFTLPDTYSRIYRISKIAVIITDEDGNRYTIPDLTKLDKSSMKKIELYLA